MDLLFLTAFWHSLGKLRLHSEQTLHVLQIITRDFCAGIQAFERYTSRYKELETRKEAEARRRQQSKNATSSKKQKKSKKGFSLETYKLHSIPDYVATIQYFGTTDSYSTQIVCQFNPFSYQATYTFLGRTTTQETENSISAYQQEKSNCSNYTYGANSECNPLD